MFPKKPPDIPQEPCAIAFVDGQNLFHAAQEAFGYTYPNYDVKKLSAAICAQRGWKLTQVRFYSGVPPRERSTKWHEFWSKKTLRMSRAGVHVFTRPLRYTDEMGSDGTYFAVPREKGIDVRIAIDVMTLALRKVFDVALIFSQDQDLAELASELREVARRQERWIKVASAYPVSDTVQNTRGINQTDWIKMDKATYDACLDDNA